MNNDGLVNLATNGSGVPKHWEWTTTAREAERLFVYAREVHVSPENIGAVLVVRKELGDLFVQTYQQEPSVVVVRVRNETRDAIDLLGDKILRFRAAQAVAP
jgi:hypothetical protein